MPFGLQAAWMAPLVVVFCCLTSLPRCSAQTSASPSALSATDLLQRGVNEASRGEWAAANLTLEQAQKLAPENLAILTSLGKVKAKVGEVAPAIVLFRQVARSDPRSGEAHQNLAVALADAQNLPEALTEIMRAQQLSPRMTAVHLNHARILADLHRRADAEAEFSEAATLEPLNPNCFFYWALLEREHGDYGKETPLLRSLVKIEPRNDEAWLLLGNSYGYQSQTQEAIASWRKALAINPRSSQAVYKLSRALRASDPAEAKKLEDDFTALRQSSESLDKIKSLGNQGYLAMQSKNWAAAISTFKQAVELCGDCAISGTLHKDLGLAYCNCGQWSEGRRELELALRLSPNDPDIPRALAVLDHSTEAHP